MVPMMIEFLFLFIFYFHFTVEALYLVRDNNSTTSKQNSNKQTASGFDSETCSRVGFKN